MGVYSPLFLWWFHGDLTDLTTIFMVIFREDLPSDYLMGSSNGILMEWNRIIIHFLWDIPSGNWLQVAIEAMAHL